MSVVRLAPDELLVTEGADIERLMAVATHPLDPQAMGRTQAHAFPPAKLYVAALGHLVRAYIDPNAWIRQAAFNLTLRRLQLRASPDDLDWIVEQMQLQDPAGKVRRGEPIEFRFSHIDEEGAVRFDPERLQVLAGDNAVDLIERDADAERGGVHLLGLHLQTMDELFTAFLIESLALEHGEVTHFDFEFRPWGYAWDGAVDEYAAIRSPNETMGDAEPPETGFLGRILKRGRPNATKPTPPAPSPEGAE